MVNQLIFQEAVIIEKQFTIKTFFLHVLGTYIL